MRGYYESPQVVHKPEEMSMKWKKQNHLGESNCVDMLQNTLIYEQFKELNELFDCLPGIFLIFLIFLF